MKVPICKLCGKAHWLYEDHYTATSAGVPEYVTEMVQVITGTTPPKATMSPQTAPTESVPTTDVPTCECGKPREGRYKTCSACRKRAYRERSKK